MFFARIRWIGRVLDAAGIDTASNTGKELTAALVKFSKYCQEMNRRGEGARRERLDVGPAEWALLAAMLAPEEASVSRHISGALGIPNAEASALIARTRKAALELAEKEKPGLLAILAGD